MKVTNENGYSFEIDKGMTDYTQNESAGGTLPALDKKYVVLKMTKEEAFIGYILFDTKEQKPLTEPLRLDEICCKIDAYKYLAKGE